MAVISDEMLMRVAADVATVEGAFVEVGVFRGDTFKRLSLIGRALRRTVHGFDSFQGMAPPTDKDGGHYPEGKLSVGGIEKFRSIMKEAGIPEEYFTLHGGFIPGCFDTFLPNTRIALAVVDVDQYAPTVEALDWVWARLNYGGALILDDYFPGRTILASAAIDDWMKKVSPFNLSVVAYKDTQLILKKTIVSSLAAPYETFLQRL